MKKTLLAGGLITAMATATSAQDTTTGDDCILGTYDQIATDISESLNESLELNGLSVSTHSIYSSDFTRGVAAACAAMTGDDDTIFNLADVTIYKDGHSFTVEGQ